MVQPDTPYIETVGDAIHWIYASYNRAKPLLAAGRPDRYIRHPEWTSRLLEAMNRPDLGRYNVAVTGSKGKGSHAILLAGILQQLGFRVGLFTGPHLVDFLERCRVNGQTISESQFVRYVQRVARAAAAFTLMEGQYFGPVGLLAVAAAMWFQDANTDVNVYELGRGALHDDVNRIVHQGAVLTPVFLEHVRELGPRLEDVAAEKAGVLTKDTLWLCSHSQSNVVREAVSQRAASTIDVRYLGEDFGQVHALHSCLLEVVYPEATYQVRLPSAAGFFLENALVAFDAARKVWQAKRPGVRMPTKIDLSTLRLPGRLEVLSEHPLTVVDGTIHAASARYLRRWIEEQKNARRCKVCAIVSVPADKDGRGVLGELAGVVNSVIVTQAHNPHLTFDHALYECAKNMVDDVEWQPYVEEALASAQTKIGDADMLVMAGTQSFVGDVLRQYQTETTSLWMRNPVGSVDR
jgi:dihydrofolate synthase / folylpolyglutamate synthase